MSWQATSWALNTDLEPVSKILLIAYADFAGEGGTGAWMYKKTLLERVTKVSESTINRRLNTLLEEGYLREGDQNALPDYVRAQPEQSRPIVYDLAMSEDKRLRWAAGYRPGPRRSTAAANGAVGGRRSAAARLAARPGGVSVQPPLDVDPSAQDPGGVSVQPPMGGGVSVQPPGFHPDDTPGGCTTVQPITYEEPTNALSRSEAPSVPQNGGAGQAAKPAPKPRAKRTRAERTAEEQERFELASRLAQGWWDYWQKKDVPVVGSFVGFRDSIVLAAIKAGATEDQVKRALMTCKEPFPSRPRFQAALVAAATGEPSGQWPGRGQPTNLQRQASTEPAEHARVAGLFSEVTVNGKRMGSG